MNGFSNFVLKVECWHALNIGANVPQLCLVADYEATQYQFSNNF